MNNEYKIIIKSPLIRTGLTIETTCSEKYLQPVVARTMEIVREINKSIPDEDR